MNFFKLSAKDSAFEDLMNQKRRTFSMGLGMLPLLSMLPACGASPDESEAQTPEQPGSKMVHPGMLNTEEDFQRMSTKVAAKASPWYEGWNALLGNYHSRLGSEPGPEAEIWRGGGGPQNYSRLFNDIAFAYCHALRWKVSGDTRHADNSVKYLVAWPATLEHLRGDTNVTLAAGIYGYEFANVGEIMRGYSGWSDAGLAAFQDMMRTKFLPINKAFLNRPVDNQRTHYWANWELCNLASLMAIGILCDDHALFDEAVDYYKNGPGNGSIANAVYHVHPGYLGQWQESGRDQGHTNMGIALMASICEMAWNQGVDLYGHDNNRFLAGAEYVAKSNTTQADGTFHAVPWATYQNCDLTHTEFASGGAQGGGRPCWAMVTNHYINRKGLAAPHSKRYAELLTPEGGGSGGASGAYDQLGYSTLTHTREPGTPAPAPSGLTGYRAADKVVLSWWGCSNATSYNVKRATTPGGPYNTIRTGITDLLTYTDTPPRGTDTCYYVVTAQTPLSESTVSNETKVVMSAQLLMHLPFSEGTGSTAADRSGNGRTATLQEGATWGTGRRGSALSLNGSGAFVALPDDLVSDVSDFTVAVWAYWEGPQNWPAIFDFSGRYGSFMTVMPSTDWRPGNDHKMRFAIAVNGWGDSQRVDAPTLVAKQWVHVAVTLSGSTATLYVDGSAVASNTGMFLAPFRLGGTTFNRLGRSQYPNSTFKGLMEDFRLYRGALSAAEIVSLMSS